MTALYMPPLDPLWPDTSCDPLDWCMSADMMRDAGRDAEAIEATLTVAGSLATKEPFVPAWGYMHAGRTFIYPALGMLARDADHLEEMAAVPIFFRVAYRRGGLGYRYDVAARDSSSNHVWVRCGGLQHDTLPNLYPMRSYIALSRQALWLALSGEVPSYTMQLQRGHDGWSALRINGSGHQNWRAKMARLARDIVAPA